ncbi:MAG: prephenate dehydratase [Deltaproteobacteria bacterium]|nr:prephenate dehydratase [Candidatus Zymogenaceae bacterium]
MAERKDLLELRSEIDRLDEELVRLIKHRVDLAVHIGRIKAEEGIDVFDAAREAVVMRRLLELWGGDHDVQFIENIYREIIGVSHAVQRSPRIAYLGPVASFTYSAALRKFGGYCQFFAARGVDDVFDGVFRQEADYGVVPVENSTEGIVTHTLDMFLESNLKIVGEIYLRISFDLMNKTGRMEDIQKIISHPQGLAQTRRWIAHNLPKAELVEAASTSEAALLASKDQQYAAVAGEDAGKMYELAAVKRDIGDKADNYTRFLIIAEKSPPPTGDDKTTILFSVKDRPGILHKVLGPLAKRNINLSKIESRPSRRELWDYVFFLDLLGHIDDKKISRALDELKKYTTTIRYLGSYPRSDVRRN